MHKESFQNSFQFRMGLEFSLAPISRFHLPTTQPSLLFTHHCPLWGPHSCSPTFLCFPTDAALHFPSSEVLEQQYPRYPVCSVRVWKPPLTSVQGGLREFFLVV